ncbi:MAG: hypothetical protein ACE5EC_03375 [Phycisphaerae bacterium]
MMQERIRQPNMASNRSAPARRGGRSRRAYILIVVLGLTLLVTSLGIAFLEANSTAMPEAFNRLHAARAQYLAESGIFIGAHYLMYPPTTVPAGQSWTGVMGLAIDTTLDYTDVSISPDINDNTLFTLTALGIAHDFDGNPKGQHQIVAQAILPDDPQILIPYGLLTSSVDIPSTVEVLGDIHANSDLVGRGWCNGNVTATGLAVWSGTGPPISVISKAAPFPTPTIDPTGYETYRLKGVTYSAHLLSSTTLSGPDAAALNLTDMSATNPGRVILAPGDLVFKANVQLTGTLVVVGKLTLERGFALTAMPGFPALVVGGDIDFKHDNVAGTVVGSILCAGRIKDSNMKGILFDVTGACVTVGGFDLRRSNGSYRFTWDTSRATFWNFDKNAVREPITLLSWKEN